MLREMRTIVSTLSGLRSPSDLRAGAGSSTLSATPRVATLDWLVLGVVDRDVSTMSKGFVDAICSALGLGGARFYSDLDSAENAVRCGRSVAVICIPWNFERDTTRGRRPCVTMLFCSEPRPASRKTVSNAIRSAVSAATGNLEAGPPEIASALRPVLVEQHVAPRLQAVNTTSGYAERKESRGFSNLEPGPSATAAVAVVVA